MIAFDFATAGRIVFGRGTFDEIGLLARDLGSRPLVVTGRAGPRVDRLLAVLDRARLAATALHVSGEPDLAIVRAGVARARAAACDFVVAMGGGSALDTGKAVAALLTNDGDVTDYLEIVGRGRALQRKPAPCVAIPTTAGTGSEATRNSVLFAPEQRVKVSLRSRLMLPDLAVIDPELSASLPPTLTATTGLDALTQLIEPYVSRRANAMTDALCVEGIRRAAPALRRAFQDGSDLEAREAMALASLWSGLALSNAGLGAVHGLAGPIGGMFPAPHGAICAALLPVVMSTNLRVVRARAEDMGLLRRFEDVARILTGSPTATADDGAAWLRQLTSDMGIPGLRAYGLTEGDFSEIVERARRASSMQGNPVELTPAELTGILMQAL